MSGTPDEKSPPGASASRMPHAFVMMLLIISGSTLLTYLIPSGAFERSESGLMVPGTYQPVTKEYSVDALLGRGEAREGEARPAAPIRIVSSIPEGMQESASLIFMIMLIGGMIGVLQATGALDAGIERLLGLTSGNIYLLAPILMLALAAGSTFLGLISQYLVIIPLIVALVRRLGLENIVGLAIVTVAASIGYIASVTNPIPLLIAQPIVGVVPFSGLGLRLVIFVLYMTIGIGYVLWRIRRSGYRTPDRNMYESPRLSGSHTLIVGILVAAIGTMVLGARALGWGNLEFGALYILVAMIIAGIGRLPSHTTATAFLEGMKGMVVAGMLVGMARGMQIILREGMVLDTIISSLSSVVGGQGSVLAGQLIVGVNMAVGVLIPSTSGQAAVTMPILGPIAQLSGMTAQSSVLAFLLGNGLTNLITPTSGVLLAYLATARVSVGAWVRYTLPLLVILTVVSMVVISVAVMSGY